jgi:hypothetical protein
MLPGSYDRAVPKLSAVIPATDRPTTLPAALAALRAPSEPYKERNALMLSFTSIR